MLLSFVKSAISTVDWLRNESYLTTAFFFIAVLLLIKLLINRRPTLNLPPGPTGIPIVGYLPWLGRDVHLTLTKLAEKYGKIYKLYLGNRLTIVITDYKIIKEAFRQKQFSGRPSVDIFEGIIRGYGLIQSEGELWREQRKFALERLRQFGSCNFGEGRALLSSHIKTEIELLLDRMLEFKGKPFCIRKLLGYTVGNIICSVTIGKRFDCDDKHFKRHMELMEEGFRLLSIALPVIYLPFLKYIPKMGYVFKKIYSNHKETTKYFKEIVEEHKTTLQKNQIKDFVDAYLVEMEKKNDDTKTKSYFSDTQLVQAVIDLFGAGMETTKETLCWSFLYMITHGDIQKKVQEEIDSVVGHDRSPSLDDLPSMPYTEATLMEIQRFCNVIAIVGPHAPTEDTTLCNYTIPKGTSIVPVLWAVHMDPTLWEKPEIFNPARFLDDEGKVFKPEYFMPFSSGRRMCLGEPLAKMELFLIFTTVLQNFNLRLPEGAPTPNLKGIPAVSMQAEPYKLCALPRAH